MSASATPKQSATGSGPCGLLCSFLLLTTISSVWTSGPGAGLPGWSDPTKKKVKARKNEKKEIHCRASGCQKAAKLRLRDRAYVCADLHISRKQPDGSIKWENDPTYIPPDVDAT
jgi:hypothetical protein